MMIVSALPFPRRRASVAAMTDKERKMTDKPMTLRERVLEAIIGVAECAFSKDAVAITDAICRALEDTGAPAHMRVAKELRGGVMGHFVFKLYKGGYVGTRKNNGRMYESRPSASSDLSEARVFNTKAAASRAGSALGQSGEVVQVWLTSVREQIGLRRV